MNEEYFERLLGCLMVLHSENMTLMQSTISKQSYEKTKNHFDDLFYDAMHNKLLEKE